MANNHFFDYEEKGLKFKAGEETPIEIDVEKNDQPKKPLGLNIFAEKAINNPQQKQHPKYTPPHYSPTPNRDGNWDGPGMDF